MPLNISINDGDFTPFLKYNAKAGRFYARTDGGTEDVEIINPVLAFDMANIKTGWLFYQEGVGPEKVWHPSQTQKAPKPPGPRKFREGFEVMVYGNGLIPGTQQRIGLREMSSTAANFIGAIMRMYDEYEAGLKANQGCVPIFACEGVKAITGAYGTNYEPQFSLKGWVPRGRVPAFDEHVQAAPKPQLTVVHDERNPPPADDFGIPVGKPVQNIADTF